NLTLEETLNGLDLANQSPLAAIGRVGYIERLAEAKQNGLDGTEAILVARTRSYINPNTGRWNAPGLGNTEVSIRRDQQRRANAVASAIAAYESQHPQLKAQTWALTPSSEPAPDTLVVLADSSTEPVDEFLTMWTSPSDPIAQAEPAAETALWGETAVTETDTLAASTASDDGGLAALWQLTVGRLAALDSGGPGQPGPQAASLVGLFARGSGTPQPAAVEPEPEPKVPTSLGAPDQAVVAEPAKSAAPEPAIAVVEPAPIAIVPPTWAEVREGSQQVPSPALEAAAVPGAFPDSAVYAPIAPAAESVVPELPPATTAPTDPETAPELSPPSLVPEAAPESTASSPEPEESATAEANSLAESSALAPETLETAEPALSEHENILEFDQVDGSD
ncbi:MAG TPA: hypothetical protein VEZ50_02640, partial [Nodosilinea sp.]|nr:hypothetical protein [Nodosilinea sp.]